MAELRERVCDVEGCERRGAESFAVFSHRASDGVGSMEDWHSGFDLCPVHRTATLTNLLRKLSAPEGVAFTEAFRIVTRSE